MNRWTHWSVIGMMAGAGLAMVPAAPLTAQDAFGSECSVVAELDVEAGTRCSAVAQAVASGQPQLGILIAGGNPTIGTASTQGLRFGGLIGRTSLSFQANVVGVKLPDILDVTADGAAVSEELQLIAPALSADLAYGLLPGFVLAPRIGGVGAVDLLASATLLPFSLLDTEGFGENTPDFAYGAGVKIGLVRESFGIPGASVSLLYHRLGNVAFGDVCPGGEIGDDRGTTGTVCTGPGDVGEFGFDLDNWSARAAVSKRFVGFGFTAGLGYDYFDSEIEYAFRFPEPISETDGTAVYREPRVSLDAERWSAFVNASYTFLVATVVFEAGWLQGGDSVAGFDPSISEFDPGATTSFGSLGVRISI